MTVGSHPSDSCSHTVRVLRGYHWLPVSVTAVSKRYSCKAGHVDRSASERHTRSTELCWLTIPWHVHFRLAIFEFMTLYSPVPPCLSDDFQLLLDVRYWLWSSYILTFMPGPELVCLNHVAVASSVQIIDHLFDILL